MKVIDPGHCYELDCLDGPGQVVVLQFVKRVGPGYPGNQWPPRPGTIMQENLRALIDRCQYVDGQIPCWPTKLAIWLFRVIILLFEHRAKRRKGKWLPLRALRRIELAETCRICGHIYCTESHACG